MNVLHQARARIAGWRHDRVKFVREVFKAEPDAWQVDALNLLGGPPHPRKRLVLRACTGPGKSTVLAWEGWARLACYGGKGEHPKGAALSITLANLQSNLWPEMAKWQSRSDFLMKAFEHGTKRIFARDYPKTWFLEARSYERDADESAMGRALSGLHSKFPFVLLDEIGDMPPAVGRIAEQIFTGNPADALILAAGNPTSTTGLLYEIASLARDGWLLVVITADPDDPKRTPRVSIKLAREQIDKYGRTNPWVMATILGLFPPAGFNQLLTVEEVEAAMHRHLSEDAYEFSQKRLGADVARFGDDSTVLFPRQGLASFRFVVMRGERTNAIAARIAQARHNWGQEMTFVDGTGGYGAGVIDAGLQAGLSMVDVQFGGKARDARYFNARSEMWFNMADWVKRGAALPQDDRLLKSLTMPTYTFQDGKFRMEEKDQVKRRLKFSPDEADALACTFAMPDMPGRDFARALGPRGGSVVSDWEPGW